MRWLNLRITQQFLVFFTITCILPIGIMSALFFHSTDAKFSERISRMLDIGLLFAEQAYQKDLEKLSLSTTEAASFYVRREYQDFARTGAISNLESILNQYVALRNLDILNLYDQSGHLIAHAGPAQDLSPAAFRKLQADAYRGRPVSGVERYAFPTGTSPRLEYVALSPIFYPGSHRVAGVLMTGQSLIENASFKGFQQALPEMDLRVYADNGENPDYRLLYSSIQGAPDLLSAARIRPAQPAPRHHLLSETETRESFTDRIGNTPYRNKALVLRNYAGEPVGLLVVSTSEKDLLDLKLRNLFYLGLALIFVLGVVSIAGIWFKRTFVDPVESLSHAAEQVARGNLETMIDDRSAQPEIRKTIHSFNRMTGQLQEDQRLRSTFVSTLTHDLRTPLIAQKRVLELYEEMQDELPSDLESLNAGLIKSNDQLLEMVNKLLETYQYEAGKITLLPERLNLRRLVTDCMDELQGWAQQKFIVLSNEVPAELEGYWDRDQLRRVFQNLIGNALENIQDEKAITVSAEDRDGEVLIAVRDNGPGINPDILPLLFTRYFTGDRLRQKIGSGLGLYICRMIIELHGGTIKADSNPGAGTVFLITLPLGRQAGSEQVQEATA